MNELSGKVMFVTGGASGLGRDVAVQAAEQGARIAIMDVRADRLDETRVLVEAAGAECLVIQADLTKEDDVVRTIAAVVDRFGQLDIVVNSAGVFYGGPIEEMPIDHFDRIFAVNVRGLYLVCREAAKVMLPRGDGHLINIASIAGKRAFLNESAYSTSKWAVVGLGENLHLELGPRGIRTTTVCPGGMATNFWEATGRQVNPERMLTSATVAKAIVQLASLPPEAVMREALVYKAGL